LQDALISGNPENMRAYFDVVIKAVSQGTISPGEYKQLLTGANRAGFTPLHQAANSGNFTIYLEFTKVILRDLELNEFKACLEKKTGNGHMPLCQYANIASLRQKKLMTHWRN
jgi:hypothetical protein